MLDDTRRRAPRSWRAASSPRRAAIRATDRRIRPAFSLYTLSRVLETWRDSTTWHEAWSSRQSRVSHRTRSTVTPFERVRREALPHAAVDLSRIGPRADERAQRARRRRDHRAALADLVDRRLVAEARARRRTSARTPHAPTASAAARQRAPSPRRTRRRPRGAGPAVARPAARRRAGRAAPRTGAPETRAPSAPARTE